MARLLIKKLDSGANSLSSRAGDIVIVMSDQHTWGRKEWLPTFYHLDVVGASVSELERYMYPDVVDGVTKHKRRYSIDLSGKEWDDGLETITLEEFQAIVIDKRYI